MKSVLCYGDSLTWGSRPDGQGRHAPLDRWPNVLQEVLGSGVQVISEALPGRTTVFEDGTAPENRNGATFLPTVLTTHSPLDLIIIILGTNDLKPWIAGSPLASARGLGRLVDTIVRHAYPVGAKVPGILLVAPPHLTETDWVDFPLLFPNGIALSKKLSELYASVAEQKFCNFFDAATVSSASPLDGIHLDGRNSRAIGEGLAGPVRALLDIG
ncbi:SGNH/GDSL hydrolase family protein [Limoniibacter endophyticus]|uniref:Arylesterase n=1 Tax=Limoniibacter endophyticus TaxID=1565040 RepID=A0A8J3DGA1_9HYPH|nr:SGNH/GDSL hydrolase family protein [Limoniibacter endophyticus]GHC62990.1 arylesterase [Limoniibacter endophyticus]